MINISHNSSPRSNDPVRDLTAALETISHQIQSQLGSGAQTAFFVGDGLQRVVADGIFDAFEPRTWSPRNLARIRSQLVEQSTRLSGLLAPRQARLAWRELANKAEVFRLVKNLPSVLKLPQGESLPLQELVEKAYALSAYEALWAVEGVGHYYTDDYWKHKGPPRRLLTEGVNVPAKSLLMLHAGMGLCIADRLIGDLTTESKPSEVREALERFVTLCKENSREGYIGAAIESLGIVTRDFYPNLSKVVTQQFRFAAPEFTGFYWHGIGRAIYFSRKFFIPRLFSMWGDVDHEATTEAARLSVMAGLTWAFTLVNMRQPEIVEAVVRSYHDDSPLATAFSNGVCSCIVMRSDTTPDQDFVSAFYEHQPSGRTAKAQSAWKRRIYEPAKIGVQEYHPLLSRHSALDQVFRYQNLGELVERFRAEPESAAEYGSDSKACGCFE